MARNNPDKAKEVYKTLVKELMSYGEEGAADLDDIVLVYSPDKIFMLDQGPERQARSAQLITEMRERLSELARERQQKASREADFAVGKYGRVSPDMQISGNHDGFRYIITKLPNGKWLAKITRQARNVIEAKEAPSIYDSPYLREPFRNQRDAELAVRRAINTAMIWYSEHLIVPREKARKTKAISGSISRRTSGQVAVKALTEKEKAQADAERRRRRAVKDKRLEDKVKRAEQGRRRPKEVQALGPGRKRVYIPKGNPEPPPLNKSSAREVISGKEEEPPFFERVGKSAARAYGGAKSAAKSMAKAASKVGKGESDGPATIQAKKDYSKYKEYEKLFSASVKANSPDFEFLIRAYDKLESSRLNFKLDGNSVPAAKVLKKKSELAKSIIKALEIGHEAQVFRANYEAQVFRANYEGVQDADWIENPSKARHEALGSSNMASADLHWNKYLESGKLPDLLNAYKHLEIAREECKHAKDSEGAAHAKSRISLVRKEFKNLRK